MSRLTRVKKMIVVEELAEVISVSEKLQMEQITQILARAMEDILLHPPETASAYLNKKVGVVLKKPKLVETAKAK